MGRVLVVDDDARLLKAFDVLLEGSGHDWITANSAEAGIERAAEWRPGVVVLDVQLPGMSGLEAVERFREVLGAVPIIVMTGASSMDSAVTAARLGAWEYRPKPFDPDEMLRLIDRALRWSSPEPTNGGADDGALDRDAASRGMAGQSPRMQEVYRDIGRVASTDTTVLIRGESGTGKELVAHALHRYGSRSSGPMVVVNCVAIPESLLETELFGHERGAFTGAVQRRVGRFEKAAGGTIFLDEIGDLPLGLQGKILRVLQERTFERVGGSETLKADTRILAATNRNLEKAIRDGSFREDLFHRLNVVTIQIPPLREHREDLPALVPVLLARSARSLGIEVPSLAPEAMAVLEAHDWPGNVRELGHCLERALIFSRGFPIGVDEMRHALNPAASSAGGTLGGAISLEALIRAQLANQKGESVFEHMTESFERLLLREAMRQAGGRQSAAAQILGLPRPTLHAKLQRHRLRSEVGAGAEAPERESEAG